MKNSIILKIIASVILGLLLIINIDSTIDAFKYLEGGNLLLILVIQNSLQIIFIALLVIFIWYYEIKLPRLLILPFSLKIVIFLVNIINKAQNFQRFSIFNIVLEILTILIYIILIINVLYDYRFNITSFVLMGLLPIFYYIKVEYIKENRRWFDNINDNEYLYFVPIILIFILGIQSLKIIAYQRLKKLKIKLDNNQMSLEKYQIKKEKLIKYI